MNLVVLFLFYIHFFKKTPLSLNGQMIHFKFWGHLLKHRGVSTHTKQRTQLRQVIEFFVCVIEWMKTDLSKLLLFLYGVLTLLPGITFGIRLSFFRSETSQISMCWDRVSPDISGTLERWTRCHFLEWTHFFPFLKRLKKPNLSTRPGRSSSMMHLHDHSFEIGSPPGGTAPRRGRVQYWMHATL